MPHLKTRTALFGLMAGVILGAAPAAIAQMADEQPIESTEESPTLPSALETGLLITDAGGAATHLTFSADGYYEAEDGAAGGWTLEDSYLCMAASGGNVTCTSVPEDAAPGSSWTKTNADGSSTSFEIPAAEVETDSPDGEGDEG